MIDHAAHYLINQPASGQRRITRQYLGVKHREQGYAEQLFRRDESGANTILDIMIVIGDLIGKIGELRLEAGLLTVDETLAHVAEL